MSCGFPHEMLALHVSGDLSGDSEEATGRHLAICDDCRRMADQLRDSHSLMTSLRHAGVDPSDCLKMRRQVMAVVNDGSDGSGWLLRIERAVTLAFRQRGYAFAAVALAGIVSLTALAQLPRSASGVDAAVFEAGDTLRRPEGYREWVLVSQPPETQAGVGGTAATRGARSERVYIDPSSYQVFGATGRFPDGTLMVWEAAGDQSERMGHPHPASAKLLVSVKDGARFRAGGASSTSPAATAA